MKRRVALVFVVLLSALAGARGQGLDDQYVQIFNVIQEADALGNSQPSEAIAKYREAQTALQRLQQSSPDWNVKVVRFRLNYVASKIDALSAKLPPAPALVPIVQQKSAAPSTAPAATVTQPAPAATVAPPAAPSNWEKQLDALQGQILQLQVDKSILEAKLKEALAVMPAAVDPRELARAEGKIVSLQKANELLQASLASEKSKAGLAPDTRALEQAQQALADANRQLTAQTQLGNTLAQEKKALQDRLDNLIPAPGNAKALETTKRKLEDTERQLAEQKDIASRLALEKTALTSRIQSLTADADAAAALRAENALLKKQLAETKSPAPSKDNTTDAARQLAQAQAQLAALQSDKEVLQLEKAALQNRVKQLTAGGAGAAAPAPSAPINPQPSTINSSNRLRQLERERDDLQKKLDAANTELYNRKSKGAATRVEELENQLAAARARLDTFEARQVPYSAEELALFKQPDPKLAKTESKPAGRSVRELSSASAKLAAEARNYFAAKQFDKAEDAYIEVLHQDQKSVPAMVNLAVIQIQQNQFAAAETNLSRALALDPNDAYALEQLGNLRFQQKRYDDAFDALSRAAKLDPENAEIQNYLGLTLSEKGLRGPAETALRKAIQIQPNYGSAHHNLAVIYLSQQPPLVELARWHYQKALAAGFPRNPDLEKMLDSRK